MIVNIRTILVPTDFSEHAHAAIEWAVGLAKLCSAQVVALHSTWIDLPTSVTVAQLRPDLRPHEFLEKQSDFVQSKFEEIQKLAAESGVRCEVRQSARHPVSVTLEEAEQRPADLIVMGTRGRTGLQHVLLGSVAERVTRLAHCPVMSVKASTSRGVHP